MNKQCLKIFAVLLCGLLLISVPACKSETVTKPTSVTSPGATSDQSETDPSKTDPSETDPPETDPSETEQSETEQSETEQSETDPSETDPSGDGQVTKNLLYTDHPFAAEEFNPSATVASTLSNGDLLKNADPKSLNGRTLTLYTAGDKPSFNYTNSEGVVVSEWDWMKSLAEEQGFNLKLVRKSDATSLKAQRIALHAGQDLSLISLRYEELASGMTLCRSAGGYFTKGATSNGISAAVLKQSGNKLLAPIGNVQSIWYNKKLMPKNADPHTLYENNQWTTELYSAVHLNSIEKKVMPLLMESALPWATLSGKSPLTLYKNKLDSNINARVVRAVWSDLSDLNKELPAFTPDDTITYSLKEKNVAMAYSDIPTADGNSYSYVPLPTFTEDMSGTVTFCGNFLALPKYRKNIADDTAALVFAEQWCNRYAETLAQRLKELGIAGEEYSEYLTLAEQHGFLILNDASIENLAAKYLSGLTNSKVDMVAEYDKIRTKLLSLVAKYNLNY